ncbi:putative Polygalacturonase-1 non-catalytic subunit beta [Melia azedarach]|uniref:Polygalacturonase-1 non-catalytic subunit beta n=1 Tax=Melia azedarach TaxID=155640 RepID=A0ACC1XLX6_MELAZ|nr:putative Polygalacturonase-1 non-catalytic subunit beta [Melia azedarach]
MNSITVFFFIFLFLSISSFNVSCEVTGKKTQNVTSGHNPFTAKASLIRYWNKHISNNLPKPPFLLNKASPLNTVHLAKLTKLASQSSLSSHLDAFCSLANLICSFDSKLDSGKHSRDANFAVYSSKNFANYGDSRLGGVDLFKNYSEGLNTPADSFKKYSREATGHNENFISYAKDGNVATENFTSYGANANGGSGDFRNYGDRVNVPTLRFASYDSDGNNHKLTFTSYSDETNSGAEGFISYGKNGNAGPTEFASYADNANTIGSSFTGYAESGNAANDSFKAYGDSGNNPHNNFKSYGIGGNTAVESFSSYRNGANVGDDSFQSYARNANSGRVNFANYGKTFNLGNDTFKEYGKGSVGRTSIGFKSYDMGRSFKEYANKGVTFAGYTNLSDTKSPRNNVGISASRWVEPGKFFRESMLKQGNVMVMPDIRDKMPRRSFLPRSILSKLPFSTLELAKLKEIFHVGDNSSMELVIVNALNECERAPSRGETKRCVGSVEDMIDFATSVLGQNVVARTTESVNGSKQRVMIGSVRGINGGKVTKSVSCHQSLYPYLLYYCHSVPKVRVYEADIVDVESKAKVNHGVAICHIDTSAWSPGHGAFAALGSSPGQIEVCHWIFENDMTWTIAD